MGHLAQPEGPLLCPVFHFPRHRPSVRLLPCYGCPADPVRPIDPAAWLSHTAALTGALPRYGTSPCSSAVTRTSSSSLTSSVPGAPRKWQLTRLGTEALARHSLGAVAPEGHTSLEYSRCCRVLMIRCGAAWSRPPPCSLSQQWEWEMPGGAQ